VAGQRGKGRTAGAIIGCALMGLGGLVSFVCLNLQRRSAASVSAGPVKGRPELAPSRVVNALSR
jgi:hypothetical protein